MSPLSHKRDRRTWAQQQHPKGRHPLRPSPALAQKAKDTIHSNRTVTICYHYALSEQRHRSDMRLEIQAQQWRVRAAKIVASKKKIRQKHGKPGPEGIYEHADIITKAEAHAHGVREPDSSVCDSTTKPFRTSARKPSTALTALATGRTKEENVSLEEGDAKFQQTLERTDERVPFSSQQCSPTADWGPLQTSSIAQGVGMQRGLITCARLASETSGENLDPGNDQPKSLLRHEQSNFNHALAHFSILLSFYSFCAQVSFPFAAVLSSRAQAQTFASQPRGVPPFPFLLSTVTRACIASPSCSF